MNILLVRRAILLFALAVAGPQLRAQTELDYLDILPSLIGSGINACADGVYENCTHPIGCRYIDGQYASGVCSAKPEALSFAEQFVGKWKGATSIAGKTFHNYIQFDRSDVGRIPGTSDYLLNGNSFHTASFDDATPNEVILSFDSRNNDWFILDFWGTDLGQISIIELAQTSENQFDGCEFIVNFPDLTYQDGKCHQVRLNRVGSRSSLLQVLNNFIADLSFYLRELFDAAQGEGLDAQIAEKRPNIKSIRSLEDKVTPLWEPIVITNPTPNDSTNASTVAVEGSVVQTINLDSLMVNSERAFPTAGLFSAVAELDDGSNKITVEANYGRRSYTETLFIDVDLERPQVVSAASTSSSSVVIQFSEPMASNTIDDLSHFNIVALEAGSRLPGTALEFTDASQQSVRVSTGLQNNILYRITAIGVTDIAGNSLSGPQSETDFSVVSADFTGTPPDGSELLDTDGDGILDHIEIAGWPVLITLTNGTVVTVYVSSDPFNADTDGDGVPDGEELHGGLNPRNNDTDGDTLSDDAEWNRIYSDGTKQDTDGDGIQDGFEYSFFRTSPILVDTDGDQLSDPDEVAAGNRDPLIADLPSPDIEIGSVNLLLDTRFTFTDEAGQVRTDEAATQTTLTQGENDTFSTANEASTLNTIKTSEEISQSVSGEVGFEGLTVSGKVSYSYGRTNTTEQGSERGTTLSFSEESQQSSEQAYNDSLSSSLQRDVRESVTRDIIDAAIRVDLSIDNKGNIPFTISNLELTAQTQDPNNRRNVVPLASLVPENASLGSINIGALGDPSRGPFVFTTQGIFPSAVQELLKNPRGLVVQLANFDIIDQDGNNFAFTSQAVLDRTAGITFDLGDGVAESYRIATASDHDPNTGIPSGITMARALEIIGLERYPTIRDGGNGRVETTAAGTDVQAQLLNRPVEPKAIVITDGGDGTLETIPGGDDLLVAPDYETELFQSSPYILDGGDGVVSTSVSGDDELATTISAGEVIIRAGDNLVIDSAVSGDDTLVPAGRESRVLVRYKNRSADENSLRFWILFTERDISGIDLDDVVLRAGDQFDFTYVQDVDGDKVWAREEYLHGSSDENLNTDGCAQPNAPLVCDELTDFEEINEGWIVKLKKAPQGYRVYPNPTSGDSDRDKVLDDEERACGVDPRQRDTDLDGLTDWEEIFGRTVVDGIETDLVSRDPDTNAKVFTISPYAGVSPNANEVDHDSIAACDAILLARGKGFQGFATDPLNADTDGDLVDDALELRLGLNPNDSSDGPLFLDDDGDGVPNLLETDGKNFKVNGVDGNYPSNPNNIDSDDDGLPDLLERYILGNPLSADTDGDNISDRNEYKIGGNHCVTTGPGVCTLFKDLIEDNYQDYLNACERAENCDNALVEQGIAANSSQFGTSLSERDTDNDGYFDLDELTTRVINVNNSTQSFTTFPTNPDSDGDGILDGVEVYSFGNGFVSNPRLANTDDDGLTDLQERNSSKVRNPALQDKYVTISVDKLFVDINNRGQFNDDLKINASSSTGQGMPEFRIAPVGDYGASDLSTDAPTGLKGAAVLDAVISLGNGVNVFTFPVYAGQLNLGPAGIVQFRYVCSPSETLTNNLSYNDLVDGGRFQTDPCNNPETEFNFLMGYLISVDSDG